MKKNFACFLFFVFFCGFLSGDNLSEDLRQLSYSVKPEFIENNSILHVEMEFLGDSTGRTRLFLPNEWAGQTKLYESIKNLSSPDLKTRIQETNTPQTRLIIHEPNKRVRIFYSVKQQWEGPLEGHRFQKYWPIIEKEYFHFYGMVFFVYPERFQFGATQFEIVWKNFPKEWSIANSFGSNERQQNFSATLEKVRRAVYVGGDYRIRKVFIQENPVSIALRGGDWNFSDIEFYSFAEKLIAEERNFWKDYEFPYFFITLTPFGKGHQNSGGTSLFQSFDVFFYSDADLNLGLKYLFAHELFHTWNTGKLGARQNPEQLIYWFSEGFTDYYARLLLLRAGLISIEEYVSNYNDKLSRYFLSPVREAPNSKILEGYWSNEDLGRLAYQRGDVLAHRWNTLIKNRSNGSLSLDDIMISLFRSAQESSQIISHELLSERVKQMTGIDIQKDLEKYIQQGHLIDLSGDEVGPCFELKKNTIPQYTFRTGYTSPRADECQKWFRLKVSLHKRLKNISR